jgi:hypothetical protein
MYSMSIATRNDLAWVAEPASHIYLAAFIINTALFPVGMLYLFGDFIGISTDPLYLFVVLLAVIEVSLVLASLTSFKKISEILHRPKIWHNVRNGAYSQVASYAIALLIFVPIKTVFKDTFSILRDLSSLPSSLPPEQLIKILHHYELVLLSDFQILLFLLLLVPVLFVIGYFTEKFYKAAFEELGEVTGIEEFKQASRWHENWLSTVAYLYTSFALRHLSVASRPTSTTPTYLAPPLVFVSVAFLLRYFYIST